MRPVEVQDILTQKGLAAFDLTEEERNHTNTYGVIQTLDVATYTKHGKGLFVLTLLGVLSVGLVLFFALEDYVAFGLYTLAFLGVSELGRRDNRRLRQAKLKGQAEYLCKHVL